MIKQSTIQNIKEWEGVKYEVYLDSAGLPSIGVGHLVKKGEHFDKITEAEVDALLYADLNSAMNGILNQVRVPLNQNQFDALIGLVFNIGNGAFRSSTVLKKINSKASKSEIIAAWLMWTKVKTWNSEKRTWEYKESQGLVNRRNKELNLYFKKDAKEIL